MLCITTLCLMLPVAGPWVSYLVAISMHHVWTHGVNDICQYVPYMELVVVHNIGTILHHMCRYRLLSMYDFQHPSFSHILHQVALLSIHVAKT